MDRVLIITDNIQFSGHLENTLRKLGYVTDALQNEFNINERIITFNPDIIVSRGMSTRMSTLNVGKRLRDNAKFLGKAILVFSTETMPDKSQLNSIKADLILEEPVSVLKLATAILNLEAVEKPGVRDRLYKMVQDDPVFRDAEESYLVQHGSSIEQELQIVKSNAQPATDDMDAIRVRIQNELKDEDITKLSSKIEAYNIQIDKIDTDLKKGLSKRKTKQENKENRKDWGIPSSKESQELDAARKEFTTELFKKKPN